MLICIQKNILYPTHPKKQNQKFYFTYEAKVLSSVQKHRSNSQTFDGISYKAAWCPLLKLGFPNSGFLTITIWKRENLSLPSPGSVAIKPGAAPEMSDFHRGTFSVL